MASLGFGSSLAQAQGYTLRIVEDKHEQPVYVQQFMGPLSLVRTLPPGEGIHLIPGGNYFFWFADDDGEDLAEDSPFLRVGFTAAEESLDVEIPFDYIRPYDSPDALIGAIQSPVAYSSWIQYLKLNKIGIYFRGAKDFQSLPQAASERAPMEEEDDHLTLSPQAETKEAAAAAAAQS